MAATQEDSDEDDEHDEYDDPGDENRWKQIGRPSNTVVAVGCRRRARRGRFDEAHARQSTTKRMERREPVDESLHARPGRTAADCAMVHWGEDASSYRLKEASMKTTAIKVGSALALAAALVGLSVAPANAYNLLGPKWGNSPVTVLQDSSNSAASRAAWRAGNADFNSLTDVKMESAPGSVALIYQRSVNSKNASWDGITYWTQSGGKFKASTNMYLNTKYTAGYDAYKRRGVAAHELGHGLGLDHVSGCHLMNGATTTRCGISRPTADEINGINKLY